MYVVAGGSDGLGKAIVSAFADAGYTVMNVSRRENSQAQYNVCCDLATIGGIETALNHILQAKESLDAVIFSAGVFSFDDIDALSEVEYDRVFSINTKAPLLLMSKLMDKVRTDEADIVLINSIAGLGPYKNQAIYNASKAALHSFANDLRLVLSELPCRVIGIYSGMLDTNLAQKPPVLLPRSKHPTIDPAILANYILHTLQLPKVMEVTDLVINRKKLC